MLESPGKLHSHIWHLDKEDSDVSQNQRKPVKVRLEHELKINQIPKVGTCHLSVLRSQGSSYPFMVVENFPGVLQQRNS